MAIERKNPLPIGHYWIDLFGPNILKAGSDWMKKVAVRTTEEFDGDIKRAWILFDVKTPIPWDAVTYGFPTIAAPNITTSDDTVQKPPSEHVPDTTDLLEGVIAVGKTAAFLMALYLTARIVQDFKRR